MNSSKSFSSDCYLPRLQITVTNEGPKRAISIQNPECDLLDRHKAGSDPPGLWLHSPGRTPPDQGLAERDGNRWVADFPTDQNRVFGDFRCGTRTYASDEELQNEYLVWDDYRIDGYLEPGTYRWEEPGIAPIFLTGRCPCSLRSLWAPPTKKTV